MKFLKTILILSIFALSSTEVFAGWPYSMTYSPVSGDTIQSEHITTSNTEHINNNIPESIDDYSNTTAEMRLTRDPYPAAAVSLATTLDDELESLRYVIAQITKETYWYIDPPTFCENSADYDHGTGDFTTGGKIVMDWAGSGISTDGSINFGTNTAALWSDGTDLFGSSTADISLNATGNDHIFQSNGVTQATIDDTGIDIITGNDYMINSVSVLSGSTLGSGVTSSSLTSFGASPTISGFTNATHDHSNAANGGLSINQIIRATYLKIVPGTGTDITINDDFSSARGFNSPTLADGTDIAAGETDGAYTLSGDGLTLTITTTETIVGILSVTVSIHDLLASSNTITFFPLAIISSGNITVNLLKAGEQAATAWTTAVDSGGRIDMLITYVTST